MGLHTICIHNKKYTMKNQQKSNPRDCLTPVSLRARAILDRLTTGLTTFASSLTFDYAPESFLAVQVEYVDRLKDGQLYKVAHYCKQHGDVLRYPEVVFLKDITTNYYPISYQQDGPWLYLPLVTFQEGTIIRFQPKDQQQITTFCNTWISNIYEQQFSDLMK